MIDTKLKTLTVETKDLWTIDEAAEILGVTRRTIYKYIKQRKLFGIKVNGYNVYIFKSSWKREV